MTPDPGYPAGMGYGHHDHTRTTTNRYSRRHG